MYKNIYLGSNAAIIPYANKKIQKDKSLVLIIQFILQLCYML